MNRFFILCTSSHSVQSFKLHITQKIQFTLFNKGNLVLKGSEKKPFAILRNTNSESYKIGNVLRPINHGDLKVIEYKWKKKVHLRKKKKGKTGGGGGWITGSNGKNVFK